MQSMSISDVIHVVTMGEGNVTLMAVWFQGQWGTNIGHCPFSSVISIWYREQLLFLTVKCALLVWDDSAILMVAQNRKVQHQSSRSRYIQQC